MIHLVIQLFFSFLILCVIIGILLTWLPIARDNPVSRFIEIVTAPVKSPFEKRIPPIGFLNITPIIVIWALYFTMNLILAALPGAW